MKINVKLLIGLVFFGTTQLTQGQPAISKKQFHLYLLAGQSNMAGRGTVEMEDKLTQSKIWMLDKTNKWVLASEPLHFDKPTVVGVGPGFAFAKEIAKMDTNIVIGLIPCAVGGSPISAWNVGQYYEPTKSHPYDDAIQRTKIAMQTGKLKGVLWQQGESDSDSLLSKIYGQQLESLVNRFRKNLKINKLPFIAGKIASFYLAKHPFAKYVNEGIEQLPKRLQRIAIVDATALNHKGDETHFDSPSARVLGKRYAIAYQKLTQKVK